MRHHPTVFGTLLQAIPWGTFDRLVSEHGNDRGTRGFKSRDHLIAMLGSALGGLHGLRQTVAGLTPGNGALQLIGSHAPCRSTLSDANALRSPAPFLGLLQAMVACAHRSLRRDIGEAVRLIDSTQVNLGLHMRRWVGLHRNEPTAKIHVVYDPRAERPVYFALTPARISDITVAKQHLPIEPGATYVFDLGYYDFAWWAALRDQGCRIITRLKSNTRLHKIRKRPVAKGGVTLSDHTGLLPERMAASRHNPFDGTGREITIRIGTGRKLRLFTNDLTSPADEIAELYKERWQIELFFKWIKQNLRIARFMGSSENAVRIQIATAMIAYLLVRLAQATNAIATPASIVLTVIRTQLFTRKPLAHLIRPPPSQPRKPDPQLALFGRPI